MTNKIILDTGLVVTNIRPRADSSGSWSEDYSDATVSREPTKAEFEILQKKHKIVGIDFCVHSVGGAPKGWDEQRNRMAFQWPTSIDIGAVFFLTIVILAMLKSCG